MKIAIAGLGFRLANVIASFRKACPELEIVGLMDPQPAGLPAIQSAGMAAPRRFETIEAMLTQTKPDLLMVGSPNLSIWNISPRDCAQACGFSRRNRW